MSCPEYDEDIKQARFNLEENNIHTKRQQKQCEVHKEEIGGIESQIFELEEKINSIPAEIINIVAVKNSICNHKELVKIIGEINKGITARINLNQEMFLI